MCDSVAFFRWFCVWFGVGGGSSKYRPRLIRSLSQLVHSLALQVLANERTNLLKIVRAVMSFCLCFANRIISYSVCLSRVQETREEEERETGQ